MERNTKTTLSMLQFGDRFYKVGDFNKEVYQLIETKGKGFYCRKDQDWNPTYMNANTEVIFLRHKTN